MVGTARCAVPARVVAGGTKDRVTPAIRKSCAAARGADIAARCPYHAKQSASIMPLIFFVPNVPVAWAIALFSIAYFGQQSWSTLVMILPADIFPKNTVGAVAGLVGFGGAMGA